MWDESDTLAVSEDHVRPRSVRLMAGGRVGVRPRQSRVGGLHTTVPADASAGASVEGGDAVAASAVSRFATISTDLTLACRHVLGVSEPT